MECDQDRQLVDSVSVSNGNRAGLNIMNKSPSRPMTTLAKATGVLLALSGLAWTVAHSETDYNEPGIYEPVSSFLQGKDIRIPNTDQSVDGIEQSNIDGVVVYEDAENTTSLLGHPITRVASYLFQAA